VKRGDNRKKRGEKKKKLRELTGTRSYWLPGHVIGKGKGEVVEPIGGGEGKEYGRGIRKAGE